MAISSIVNEPYSPQVYGVQTAPAAEKTSAADKPEAAEKPASSPAAKQDAFVSSGERRMDVDTVNRMKAELEANKLRFIDTIQRSLGSQLSINFGQGAWKGISEEDMKILQADAIEATSENGYWGVAQTSQRIFSFAQALVGTDPSRAAEMREAFIKGYQQVEKMWGGELPELSRNTYDSVIKLFDQWEHPETAAAGDESAKEPAGSEAAADKAATDKAGASAEIPPVPGADAAKNQTILSAMGVGAAT